MIPVVENVVRRFTGGDKMYQPRMIKDHIHDLMPTCLGCGAYEVCKDPDCDYAQPCSCVDYGE
tara:strand:- start:117 stop:305 length:189 start_codon:yes stop_codon:yes gene_type:complete